MATTPAPYEYIVLTDADRANIIKGELRTAEDQLFRASLSPAFGNADEFQARAEALKAKLAEVTPTG